MIYYLFECIDENSENCGEEFLVQAYCYTDAREIAQDVFGRQVKFWHEVPDEEAEEMGLDVY